MPLLVQICLVVATLAAVAIAVAAIRLMTRVEKATEQFTRLAGEIQHVAVQAHDLAREAKVILSSTHETLLPIRRLLVRFETLGDRTADLSDAVLGEVEPALRTAVAVARGVKTGTALLLEQLSNRFLNGRSATHERSNHDQ